MPKLWTAINQHGLHSASCIAVSNSRFVGRKPNVEAKAAAAAGKAVGVAADWRELYPGLDAPSAPQQACGPSAPARGSMAPAASAPLSALRPGPLA